MNIDSHAHAPLPHLAAHLAQMKKALRRRLTDEYGAILSPAVIRRALDDAEQTAADTGFPHLVLPLLAEESVRRLSRFLAEDQTSLAHGLEPVAA